jgi:hypothetical protein
MVTLGVLDAKRGAVVVAEIELGKVAVQVLHAAVLIDALDAALEDRELALNRVRVDRAILKADVLALTMAGEAVAGELIAELLILTGFVHYDVFRAGA